MVKYILYNLLQVLFVVGLSPLFAGILTRARETVQSKRGASIFQPYRDLWKLFHKNEVVPEESTWIFRAAPYLAFATPVFVALLIPVLTRFPLFLAFAGDMLAAGSVLALGGFFTALAAVDTANPYGPMGASRARMVSFLAEPIFMIVFFTVSFVAGSTIPYIVQVRWVTPPSAFFEPVHVLLLLSFLMIVLAENGRIPVDNPSGHVELAMIDESRVLEYSGRAAALVKWGGHMKLTVLMIVFLNVLLTPWGLAASFAPVQALIAILLVTAKILAFLAVLVVIESSLAKLRLFRISEFLAASFIIAVAALVSQLFAGGTR